MQSRDFQRILSQVSSVKSSVSEEKKKISESICQLWEMSFPFDLPLGLLAGSARWFLVDAIKQRPAPPGSV